MKILCIGDVVGAIGCRHLLATLPRVKRELAVDVCVVHGENSADGNEGRRNSAREMSATAIVLISVILNVSRIIGVRGARVINERGVVLAFFVGVFDD